MSSTPIDEQAELMTSLLEGADPDCWVVIPASALVTQMLIALRETTDTKGEARPGMAAARLLRSLGTIGYTRTTRHERKGHE